MEALRNESAATAAAAAAELAQRPYHELVEEVVKCTSACRGDFDHRILLILDALHERDRVAKACEHLKNVLGQTPRANIVHWRGYLHKLLRDFDEDAYHSVKAKLAASYAEHLPWLQEPPDHEHLRPEAATFLPGHLSWVGALSVNDFAAAAAHRLRAEAAEFGPGMPAWDPNGNFSYEAHLRQLASGSAFPVAATAAEPGLGIETKKLEPTDTDSVETQTSQPEQDTEENSEVPPQLQLQTS